MASEELIRKEDRLPSGGSPVIGDEPQLERDCRCKCSFECLVEGPKAVKRGQKRTYKLKLSTPALNDGCKSGSFEHTETEWRTRGAGSADVELSEKKKESVDVEVKPGATVAPFFLLAVPRGQCTCVGAAGRIVECSCSGDEVEITIEA